jgi:hypothetical protein
MKRLTLLAVVVLAGPQLYAQAPATPVPAPAPAATPAPAVRPDLPPRPPFARENQLIETGGFEMPRVKGRQPQSATGTNFLRFAQGEWIQFAPNQAALGGKVSVGMTDDMAHSGRQSLYVSFDHATARLAAYTLATDLIPVKPGKPYHVSIWGRIDRKHPITLDQRVPVLRLQVDFFGEDRETQSDETNLRVQPIPGTLNRPPLFTSERWNEFFADFTAPEDAHYIKVGWSFSTTADPGDTSGTIFFDDATIEGEKVEPVEEPTTETEVKPAIPVAPGAAAPAGPK